MQNFIKSYALAVFINAIFVFWIIWFVFKDKADSADLGEMSDILGLSFITVLFMSVFYLTFMFIIGLPLFTIVKKYKGFSWGHAILMGLLLGIAMYGTVFLLLDSSDYFLIVFFIIFGVFFSAIFAPIHYWFKKR